MTPTFFNPVWKRDKGICQECGKKLYNDRIAYPYEESSTTILNLTYGKKKRILNVEQPFK
ncbi:MAG: hypothetical protein ACFE8N_12995 [Promethearchaeota archaeon]